MVYVEGRVTEKKDKGKEMLKFITTEDKQGLVWD